MIHDNSLNSKNSKKLNVSFIQGEDGVNFDSKGVSGNDSFRICVENRSGSYLALSTRVQLGEGIENNHTWYQVNPTVSKIPHESETYFEIEITDYPIRGVKGKIPISIEVFSEEDKTISASLDTKVDILSFESLSFSIWSNRKEVRVGSGQIVKIPIHLQNHFRRNDLKVNFQLEIFSQPLSEWREKNKPQDKFSESWTVSKEEYQSKELFEITIPGIAQKAVSANSRHHFAVIMTYHNVKNGQSEFTQRDEGTLIIEPTGSLKFTCDQPSQELPPAKSEKISQGQTVSYGMSVENASNLPQTVQLKLACTEEQLQEAQECNLEFRFVESEDESEKRPLETIVSKPITLAPDEEETLYLELSYGQKLRAGTLNFDVVAENISEGEKRPWENRRLPLTLQVNVPSLGLGGLLCFVMFLLFLWAGWRLVRYWNRGLHQYPMTAVALQGTDRVWTGAGAWRNEEDSGELFGWDINRNWLMNRVRGWDGAHLTSHQLHKSSQVRLIRQGLSRSDTSGLMAVGLSNGEIYTFRRNQPESRSLLNSDESGDNLFDLAWNDETVLFSAHGSGQIRRWDVTPPGDLGSSIRNNQPVYSIANVRGHAPDSRWLLFGSGRNQFGIWMWRDDPEKVVTMALPSQRETTASMFSPIYGQEDFLSSFAVEHHDNRLLMIGDTTGSIRLLDLERLRECFSPIAGKPRRSLSYPNRYFGPEQRRNNRSHWDESNSPEPFCSDFELIVYENRDQHGGAAVRSVAIAEYERCHYGASVGDDGTVALWLFRDSDVGTQFLNPTPIELGSVSRPSIGSVDIEIDADRNQVLIAVASDNQRVDIYRRGLKNDRNCQ